MDEFEAVIAELQPHINEHSAAQAVLPHIHPQDFIFRFLIENPTFPSLSDAVRYYFFDGRQSAEKLRATLAGLGVSIDEKFALLEFASGYGCVTRHLTHVLPKVDVTACDIHAQATEFIQTSLCVKSTLSSSVPEDLVVSERYDIVFALSFFSHMPEVTWRRWLAALLNKVKPGGFLLFTTQGELSGRKFFSVPSLPENGFWFQASSEQKDLDTEEYGQTLVSLDYVQVAISQLSDGKLVLMHPGFWWNHQDLYGVQKL